MQSNPHCCSCPSRACAGCPDADPGPSRRTILTGAAAAASLAAFAPLRAFAKEPDRQQPMRAALRVQPVLAYDVTQRRVATSWRNWGGVQTPEQLAGEKERIGRELAEMRRAADFPLEVRPLEAVETADQAAAVSSRDHDVAVIYGAGGDNKTIEALTPTGKWSILFVRHRSGPAYVWYEIAHPRYLRKTVDDFGQPGMSPQDVVVDSHAEVLWRLRGLSGLKNTLGKRIVTVGGPSGWGDGGRNAPERAREQFKLEIVDVGYPELAERIKRTRQNDAVVTRARAGAEAYLKQKGVKLETSKQFVENAFVLTEVFRDLLDEAHTDAITINNCMGTIMPMSETTACLPLSLLNDGGYMAFCESDFVVIPSGILLHYIAGKPMFLNDPTYPHDGLVTLAHCTGPRKMDGVHDEPVRILTHFESDYGAAPKVEMAKGRKVTNLIPDFASKKWVGFEAEIVDAPFYQICRSQIDVQFKADNAKLLEEMKGFHWMTSYGSYLRETGYALNKAGVGWLAL
ncbi:MAG: sugar isomerase [Acidobacteriota bacterium]